MKKFLLRPRRGLIALLSACLLAAVPPAVRAQTTATLTTLSVFSPNTGSEPVGNLVQGDDGNFYGVTQAGGTDGSGVVFRLTPAGSATVLFNFNTDVGTPVSGLSKGSDGNFYGATTDDYGTVFRITPAGVLTVLHTFNDGTVPLDGEFPDAPPVEGSDGNFYGTTSGGGAHNDGIVYRMTPAGAVTVLHSFDGSDGTNPQAALVQGSNGNFYGTTFAGGETTGGGSGQGTAFQITPAGVLTTLHTFTSGDGANPQAALIQGSDGYFYGTTAGNGIGGSDGTVFRLASSGGFKVLHTFAVSDGEFPLASLVQGSDGAFYGTASDGGADSNGTVFRISAAGDFSVLHSFVGSDGLFPTSGLIQSSNGTFYGLTKLGGENNYDAGTFFQLNVAVEPAFFAGETALGNSVYFLAFPGGNYFGFYSFLNQPGFLYHFDLGYEYVIDAADGQSGIYLYDFASKDFFYTSPGFPFPYLYDFGLQSVVYYYPDPNNAGHYNTNGVRYFYVFSTGQIISK